MGHIFSTRQGREFRRMILARDLWACSICGAILREGRTHRRSAVVDHLIPIEVAPDLAWDEENLWSVCKWDHDTICASIEARYADDPARIRSEKLRHKGIARRD